jgi:hypothetical protein
VLVKRSGNVDQGVQANLLDESVEVASQTRTKKTKEVSKHEYGPVGEDVTSLVFVKVQTDFNDAALDVETDINYEKILDVLQRNLSQIERAISENHRTRAFKSEFKSCKLIESGKI